jgi:hypothetical protein
MNAPATAAPGRASCSLDIDGFRGSFLNRFARVEIWIAERLLDASPKQKFPTLLGHRLEALRTAISQSPMIVRNAAKVEARLTDLAPFLELRTMLAHSVVHRAEDRQGHPVYIFQAPGSPGRPLWQSRIVLRQDELPNLLTALSNLANQICQQTPDATPSSRPRPKPAEAGAP